MQMYGAGQCWQRTRQGWRNADVVTPSHRVCPVMRTPDLDSPNSELEKTAGTGQWLFGTVKDYFGKCATTKLRASY